VAEDFTSSRQTKALKPREQAKKATEGKQEEHAKQATLQLDKRLFYIHRSQ
jgi:hypothetical protein